MNHVLVRYGEIGTKSREVRGRMIETLRDRIEERVAFEDAPHGSVRTIDARVVVETDAPRAVARAVAELPGVASSSPARRVAPEPDAILEATDAIPVGETFGVDANVAGDHDISSRAVNERAGARIAERTGAGVDLDDPDTWVEVDVRREGAYLFTERFDGPGGFPVGSQEAVVALISGGIDSPVAAYEAMTRGSEVVPVYGYNKPIAAGDHLARFEASLTELARVHPGKEWYYYLVDLEDVNEALFDVGGGRMILHRVALFRVAERIAREEGLHALLTGESMGQKSSQTTANLAVTAASVRTPVMRPLLTRTKEEIVGAARDLGTFEAATVDSACRTIAPDTPSPLMTPERLDALEERVGIDRLVEAAWESTERVEISVE